MKNLSLASLIIVLPLCLGASANAQDTKKDDAMQSCPMHKQHTTENSHHAAVEKNGDQAMGFSHDTTTHHFRMAVNGGVIEVTANDPNDKTNTEAIRSHLSHIAVMFGNGDFSTPMFVHDGIPPGVTTMTILKATIRYKYEEISAGGRVRIDSSDPVALAAIHDFIRFQISGHQTGDSLAVENAH
jgi:uncharacterized protein YegJ (DUF2314 family)